MPINQKKLIAIIGVDGSGKSTVIDSLVNNLQNAQKFSFLQGFRHNQRPAGGPIRNHSRPPRGSLISSFKLCFKALEWCWNYYSRYLPHLSRGHYLFCDRFYFDEVLIDPLKYRYGGPIWLAKALRGLVPAPGVYILLDAPVSVLATRKQEAPLEEIERLRSAYLAFLREQPAGYIIDASAPLAQVLQQTSRTLQQIK